MSYEERGLEDEAYEPEQEPEVSPGQYKLHATVSHGRKRAENGGWVSLGHSSVLNPPRDSWFFR